MLVESASPALSTLTCPRCGAGVPVADEACTACAYCREAVPVPDEYREALLLVRREVEADALTRAAFEKLGRAPSWPLRLIDVLTTGGYTIFATVFFLVVGVVHVADWLLDHCLPWLHVNAWDWFTPAELELLVWGFSCALLLALLALGAFGRRRVTELRGLHRALAARPPSRAGGPAECRHCGAPLSVPNDALGVRCAYCRSDNLVSIPSAWLARQRGALGKVTREAKNALFEHRRETRRLYLRLALRLAVVGALAALLLTSSVRQVFAGHADSFDLRAALAGERQLFDIRPGATLLGSPNPVTPTVMVDQCRSLWSLRPNRDLTCLGDECFAGWFIGLRSGEVLQITSSSAGQANLVEHFRDRGWTEAYGRSALWGSEIATRSLLPEQAASFRAPDTSWYRLELSLREGTKDIAICAKIH